MQLEQLAKYLDNKGFICHSSSNTKYYVKGDDITNGDIFMVTLLHDNNIVLTINGKPNRTVNLEDLEVVNNRLYLMIEGI